MNTVPRAFARNHPSISCELGRPFEMEVCRSCFEQLILKDTRNVSVDRTDAVYQRYGLGCTAQAVHPIQASHSTLPCRACFDAAPGDRYEIELQRITPQG